MPDSNARAVFQPVTRGTQHLGAAVQRAQLRRVQRDFACGRGRRRVLANGGKPAHLVSQIEALTEAWRLPHEDVTWLAPHFLGLLDTLRDHHAMVLDLNRDWDRFLEFKAHMAAVNQFRSQLTQWAQWVRLPGAHAPLLSDFDVSAWRVLGAGALLLDVYEQSNKADAETESRSSAWSRLVGWIRNAD